MSLAILSSFALLFSFITITALRQKSATFDEAYHLLAGYSHLKWGDFRVYPAHPPLAKLIAALPLLTLDIKDPRSSGPDWDKIPQQETYSWGLANQMVFRDNDADTLFFYAKLPMIGLGIIGGVFVYLWASELFGLFGACIALFLYALDPNILAHSSVAQTDLAFTTFFVIAAYFFWRCLRNLTWRDLFLTSLFCGLATITKFSFLNIFGIWFVVALAKILSSEPQTSSIMSPGEIRNRSSKSLLLANLFCCAALMSYVCIWAAYRFRWAAIPNGTGNFPLASVLPPSPFQREMITWISSRHLFPEAWVYGFLFVVKFLKRSAYLLGEVSNNGFWLYFPVAFAVKTPIPTLLLLVAAIGIWIFRRRMRRSEFFLLAHILIYFAIAVASPINIGLRHILPIYPFLFVLLGGTAAEIWNAKRRAARVALSLIALWYVGSAAFVYPHYLAYFNELVGGPKNGYKVLVDSNLDWGQDLKGLKAFMESKGIDGVYLSYFGTADPCYYGIQFTNLPAKPPHPLPCAQKPARSPADFVAISATELQSVYLADRHTYDWLKNYKPVAQIGYSIFVYDIKGNPDAHKNLGIVYLKTGMLDEARREFEIAGKSLTKEQMADLDLGNDAATYVNLGAAFFEKGLFDQAIELFKHALRLKPDDSDAHSNLGGAYLNKNQIDEAIKEFDAALRMNPDNAEAHNNLGTAYLRKGRIDQAIAEYKEAVRRKPGYEDAKKNLQMLLPKTSQSEKAKS